MRIIHDAAGTFESNIKDHLRSHNAQFVGGREMSERYFYLVENTELQASIHTNLFWDWVSFSDIFYKNNEVLDLLLDEIKKHYQESAVGLKLFTNDPSRAKDFMSVGFLHAGDTPSTPNTESYQYLRCEDFSHRENDAEVLSSTEPQEDYQTVLEEHLKAYSLINTKGNSHEEVVIFVAVDGDEFLGGVQAFVSNDSLYISRLAVKKECRGKKIATKLMNRLESYAREHAIHSLDLGTVEFQAKDFYEKLGFEVVMTKVNDPKGYNSYSMVKMIGDSDE